MLQRIIRHYKEPGIPIDPEVAIGRSFSITRSDWLVQVERIKPGLETADGNDVETSSLPLLGLYFFFFFERHCCAVLDILERHFCVVFWIFAALDIFPGMEFGGAL